MKTAIAISPAIGRLERCEDPACCHAGKPDGEDHAEDYPDDPAQPARSA